MPLHTLQPTFSGGEFSPALYSRVDLQKYATGLKTAKNVIIHPHGGVSNRPGTLFVSEARGTAGDSTLKSRLIPFEFSVEQSYVLEFGHKYIRVYMNGAPVAIPASAPEWSSFGSYEVNDYVTYNGVYYRALFALGNTPTNPSLNPPMYDPYPYGWQPETDGIYTILSYYTSDDVADISYTQSADVLYLVHPSYPPYEVTRFDHDNWTQGGLLATDGPFKLMNTDETHTITANETRKDYAVTLTSSKAFFYSSPSPSNDMTFGPGYLMISHDIPGQSIVADLSSNASTSSIKCGKTWRIITTRAWAGTIKIETSIDSGSTWKELRAFSSSDSASAGYNVSTSGEEPEPCLIRVTMSGYSTGTCHVNLTTDPFTQEGIVRLESVASTTSASGTIIKEIGSTSATADWAESAWSGKNGFPAAVVFYQDRLMLAGSPTEPQTIWASETGSYKSFKRSSPLVDTDGITINLPSRKMNGINSLVGLTEILALTSSTEWSVGPGSSGVFSPTSIETKVQGYRGANSVEPVVIGNRAIYVQAMGSVMRDLGYDFASNGFSGSDLSILSNHLFSGYSIIDMCYQQEPDSIVWCVRSDGKLLSMTYQKEHEVLAWTWHETDGTVESICSIPGDGYNELWMIVVRNNKRYIERFVKRMESLHPHDQHFVDSGLIYDNPKAISNVTQDTSTTIQVVDHGLSDNDVVYITDLNNPTELNDQKYLVVVISPDEFEIRTYPVGNEIDSSAMPEWSAGGYARLCTGVLTGLDHLEGKTVSILADGNVLPQQVVSGGQIDFSASGVYAQIHVGLPYTSDIETLNIEVSSQDGTMQGRFMKVSEVTLRFLNSRGGYIGPDSDTLTEIVQRTGEPLGSAIELFTGDQKETLSSSYEVGGRFFFRQVDPLPVTILAIMPTVTVGG